MKMIPLNDAIYKVFTSGGVDYKKEFHFCDITDSLIKNVDDYKEFDFDELYKKVSSFMSNSTHKIVRGRRVEDKDSVYQRVKNGKGGYKRGAYRLRRPRSIRPGRGQLHQPQELISPIEESRIINNTNYLGSAGEMAVCSELMFREYNVSRMAVDDGVDIVAIKNDKKYYIQVKTVQVTSTTRFRTQINANSFNRYSSNDCYYIIVARGRENIFLIFTANDINRLKDRGDIQIGNTVNINFRQSEGHLFIKSEDVDYAINRFDRIK